MFFHLIHVSERIYNLFYRNKNEDIDKPANKVLHNILKVGSEDIILLECSPMSLFHRQLELSVTLTNIDILYEGNSSSRYNKSNKLNISVEQLVLLNELKPSVTIHLLDDKDELILEEDISYLKLESTQRIIVDKNFSKVIIFSPTGNEMTVETVMEIKYIDFF